MCFYISLNHANKYIFYLITAAFHLGPHCRKIILTFAKMQSSRPQWVVI